MKMRDVMSPAPVSLAADEPVSTAAQAVRRIPVVRDGIPVGVVSLSDLALKKDQGSALSDVSATPPNI